MSRIRPQLTYANVISTLCLFLLLGGGAYAITRAPKNSVVSKSIKNGQVKTKDLAKNAVSGAKVADNSLSGADINESSLSAVPSATNASHATNADQLGGAAASAYVQGSSAIPAGDIGGTYADLTLKPPEAAHVVNPASFGACVGINHWQNVGGGFTDTGYYRDPFGTVHVQGMVYCAGVAVATPIFTLPPGYRPAAQVDFATPEHKGAGGSAGLADVAVLGDGSVFWTTFSDSLAANDFLSLNGISFRCGPTGQNGCP
jgi:hypothetical protein